MPASNGAAAGGTPRAEALRSLNAQFGEWVARSVALGPPRSLRKGVEDYLRYEAELLQGAAAAGAAAPAQVASSAPADAGAGGLLLPKPGSALAPPPPSFLDAGKPAERADKPAPLFSMTPTAGAANPFASGAFGGFGAGAGAGAAAAAPMSLFGGAAGAAGGAGGAAGGAGGGADGQEEPERPPSPSVAATDGLAEGEEAVHELKVKIYTKEKSSDPWKEKGGAGTFKVCRLLAEQAGTKASKPRVLLTTGTLNTVRLNAALHAGAKPAVAKNNVMMTLMVRPEPKQAETREAQAKADAEAESEPPVARLFLAKTKNASAAEALAKVIKACVPKDG